MNVLLVDIGNTRIKWARFRGKRLGQQKAAAHAGWSSRDFEREVLSPIRGIERIVVASVAGEQVNEAFTAAARRAHGVTPEFATSARTLGGVTTAYIEPWRLGVDRLVAVIGARHLAGGRAACVIDIGTAMTIDLVDAKGLHHGGVIVPGPELMVRSLLTETNGIQRRARGRVKGAGESGIRKSLFARITRDAIDQGALHAVAAAIDRAVIEARDVTGGRPIVFLTGGAAPLVQGLIRATHRYVPELVLHGLAVLAGSAPQRPRA